MPSWRATTWVGVGLASSLLAAVTIMPGVLALFDDAPTVPSNTVAVENTFGGTNLATGAHTGNAVDNRAITGLGFQPELVILKGSTTQIAQARASTMASNQTKPLTGATAITSGSNRIQSLDADGFTVGTHASVNGNGLAYSWVAFNELRQGMLVDSYSGNGTGLSITGLGFQPDYVIVMSAAANAPVQRSSTMTTTYRFDAIAAIADGITSLDADGFTVGSSAETNTSGVVYHYVAWTSNGSGMKTASYTGLTGDNRSITGVGFQPEYVIVRSATATTQGAHRMSDLPNDPSLRFVSGANIANWIQAIEADGFQVGNAATVNTNGVTYHYIAFQDF